MSDQGGFSGVHEVAVDLAGPTADDPGLVVKWRRRGDVWEGLLTHEIDGNITTEWLPGLVLGPHTSPATVSSTAQDGPGQVATQPIGA